MNMIYENIKRKKIKIRFREGVEGKTPEALGGSASTASSLVGKICFKVYELIKIVRYPIFRYI